MLEPYLRRFGLLVDKLLQ